MDPITAWGVAASEIAKTGGEFLRWIQTPTGQKWAEGMIDGSIKFNEGVAKFGQNFADLFKETK